jgi:hypothetical protein
MIAWLERDGTSEETTGYEMELLLSMTMKK